MRISLGWVREFTEIDSSVEELAELIGSRLVEVEEIINWGDRFKGIVVAQITEMGEHPNADKLAVYKATVGEREVDVVSGDQRLEVGDKVGYIPPGAAVPSSYDEGEPFVLESRKLRGVRSDGMFGSARELLLGDDHHSVLKLDTNAEPGTPLAEAYDLNDVLLDIDNKSFTHRPDCFGIIGIAREIAAIQGKDFTTPTWFTLDKVDIPAQRQSLPLEVANDVPALCPRYMAITMQNVTVAPSSLMLQSMLIRMGVRPINTIVDITNYLMLLTGQPLHAFDYDKVRLLGHDKSRAFIGVREAAEGDTLTLLDGKEINVRPGAVVITADDKPIALGGIMGGAETEIDATTRNIIIEAANFDMYNLRTTSMEHGVFTDALTRFAKGQSPSICAPVLARAVGMVDEVSSDAIVAGELIDIYPTPKVAEEITLSSKEVNKQLGTKLSANDMTALLRHAEFNAILQSESNLLVSPPLWRSDIAISEDVVDEIGRLYGFDTITPTLPERTFAPVLPTDIERVENSIRTVLRDGGANEVLTYNFVSNKLMQQTNQDVDAAYHLSNSISPELAYLRTNLLGSLLSKVHANHKAGDDSFTLFEINKTHSKEEIEEGDLPKERQSVALVFSAVDKAYNVTKQGAPFYKAKFYLEQMVERLNIRGVRYRLLRPHTLDSIPKWLQLRVTVFDLNRSAVIVKDDEILGVVGEPSAEVQKALKLPKNIAMFECDLEQLLAVSAPRASYTPSSRFPAMEQDICFRFDKDRTYGDLVLATEDFLDGLADIDATIAPVDIFQRENDKEHKQITIRIRLQHHDRTLTTKEVNELFDKFADRIHQALRGERV